MLSHIIYRIKHKVSLFYYRRLKSKVTFKSPLKLHLGCSVVYLKDYVNIDISSNSVADLKADFRELYKIYSPETVTEILVVHGISYLRYWECLDFFKQCYILLKKGGKLIIEFPDIEKCSSQLLKSRYNLVEYMEAVRGIYAFDLKQIRNREKFQTYAFGWSAWHLSEELKKTNFTDIVCSTGMLHSYSWRDSRVEATK